jgi:hypothetical protein
VSTRREHTRYQKLGLMMTVKERLPNSRISTSTLMCCKLRAKSLTELEGALPVCGFIAKCRCKLAQTTQG